MFPKQQKRVLVLILVSRIQDPTGVQMMSSDVRFPKYLLKTACAKGLNLRPGVDDES